MLLALFHMGSPVATSPQLTGDAAHDGDTLPLTLGVGVLVTQQEAAGEPTACSPESLGHLLGV